MFKEVKPIIEMKLRPMSNLKEEVQLMVCQCDKLCEEYVNLDGYGRYCANEAKELGLQIYSIASGLDRVNVMDNSLPWTYDEDKYIIEWYRKRNGRARYGDIRMISEALNRPYPSTRRHIKYMREVGRI